LPNTNRSKNNRQIFLADVDEAAPYQILQEKGDVNLRLPIDADTDNTQIAVPLLSRKGYFNGMLAMTIGGRRELTEHEALLINNIAALSAVAIENADLFKLVQE
jgi:GAF domain-containing protein